MIEAQGIVTAETERQLKRLYQRCPCTTNHHQPECALYGTGSPSPTYASRVTPERR